MTTYRHPHKAAPCNKTARCKERREKKSNKEVGRLVTASAAALAQPGLTANVVAAAIMGNVNGLHVTHLSSKQHNPSHWYKAH